MLLAIAAVTSMLAACSKKRSVSQVPAGGSSGSDGGGSAQEQLLSPTMENFQFSFDVKHQEVIAGRYYLFQEGSVFMEGWMDPKQSLQHNVAFVTNSIVGIQPPSLARNSLVHQAQRWALQSNNHDPLCKYKQNCNYSCKPGDVFCLKQAVSKAIRSNARRIVHNTRDMFPFKRFGVGFMQEVRTELRQNLRVARKLNLNSPFCIVATRHLDGAKRFKHFYQDSGAVFRAHVDQVNAVAAGNPAAISSYEAPYAVLGADGNREGIVRCFAKGDSSFYIDILVSAVGGRRAAYSVRADETFSAAQLDHLEARLRDSIQAYP